LASTVAVASFLKAQLWWTLSGGSSNTAASGGSGGGSGRGAAGSAAAAVSAKNKKSGEKGLAVPSLTVLPRRPRSVGEREEAAEDRVLARAPWVRKNRTHKNYKSHLLFVPLSLTLLFLNLCIHSFSHSFNHSFIHSFIHSLHHTHHHLIIDLRQSI
jgi:hypothetical protein